MTLTQETPAVPRPAADGAAPPWDGRSDEGAVGRRPRRRWLLLAGIGAVLVGALALTAPGLLAGTPAPTPIAEPVRPPYDARGKVVGRLEARVATLGGGVVRDLLHQPGATLRAGDAIARVRLPDERIEVLEAPFDGTLLAVPVKLGDSAPSGAVVAVVGDVSALNVDTLDVDEYLISSLRVGQSVEVEVDAVPGRLFAGQITALSLTPQAGTGGRPHYPVTVSLGRADPALRSGMNARLRFAPR